MIAIASRWPALLASAVLLVASGCGDDSGEEPARLTGPVTIEASAALAPFTRTAVERFTRLHPAVRGMVEASTDARAFDALCGDEVGIAAVSRAISRRELEACRHRDVVFFDLPIATDAIAVVVNPDLRIRCLTTDQLEELWAPRGAGRYSALGADVATGAGLPDRPVRLYGPRPGSGAFDEFTEAIEDEPGVSRTDYTVRDNERALAEAIAADPAGLGYLPYSAYRAMKPPLRLLELDDGDGCIAPRLESIPGDEYPITHSLYAYPAREALREPQVAAFLRFVLDEHAAIAEASGTAPLSEEAASEAQQMLARALD